MTAARLDLLLPQSVKFVLVSSDQFIREVALRLEVFSACETERRRIEMFDGETFLAEIWSIIPLAVSGDKQTKQITLTTQREPTDPQSGEPIGTTGSIIALPQPSIKQQNANNQRTPIYNSVENNPYNKTWRPAQQTRNEYPFTEATDKRVVNCIKAILEKQLQFSKDRILLSQLGSSLAKHFPNQQKGWLKSFLSQESVLRTLQAEILDLGPGRQFLVTLNKERTSNNTNGSPSVSCNQLWQHNAV
eukprot:CAMPEP_0174279434 /NCGR_PEP_ID=MMETSP0439-20130205/62032_1 /TAXON_ID=0 /ORGANISM="Stereomyxa ramosa, Strain Chinc5" /LENGTH=246 /DNA_ID=CAMNT_0015371957 /DNA_START=332 /DNA_END=1072 /DNA_ORIENTATION=+